MERIIKSLKNMKLNENKSTIHDLNIDCLQEVIKKLKVKNILKLEKVDKKFEFCVKEVLKQQKVLRFGKKMFCKHSANNSKISDSQTVNDFDQIKAILEKCPNIKCLQIRELVINKSLFKWLSINCKQLKCIHFYRPINHSKTPQIDFKDIGKLFSDRIEVEIIFKAQMRDDSIIALIQNMPQIKDIGFYSTFSNNISITNICPHFGHNIRSLYMKDILHLTIEDLNVIKNNTNLSQIKLTLGQSSQKLFDFICDNFCQLKSFDFEDRLRFTKFSLIHVLNLHNLEDFYLTLSENCIYFYSTHSLYKNLSNPLNKLQSIELNDISMTPTLFESFVQMCPNIDKIKISYLKVFCEHQKWFQNNRCFECIHKVVDCLSKLNRLKVLEIIDENFDKMRAFDSHINEQTFERLEELSIIIKCDDKNEKKKVSKKLFKNLIQSLTQLCDRNTKQLFTFKMNKELKKYFSETQFINGVKYNVFIKEVPKNMRIIRC
jgi:hypothetical protein